MEQRPFIFGIAGSMNERPAIFDNQARKPAAM